MPSSAPEDTSNYYNSDDSDDSDDDLELFRKPILLFGNKCECWEDVLAVISEKQPGLLDKFLILYRSYIT